MENPPDMYALKEMLIQKIYNYENKFNTPDN